MKNTKLITLLVAAALLTGCSGSAQTGADSPTEDNAHAQTTAEQSGPETSAVSADAAGSSPTIAEMLGVTDYEAPWNSSDYPELELSDVPAKGEGSVKMTLSPYALDDVCVWLLADDAYSDGGKIYCTRMYIGLTVSGVEQDITEAPQTLAAPDGTFEFDPANPQEQAGYTSMPQTYYGINGFSADSAAGCEYYTIGRRGEQDGFYLSPLGHTDERCMLTPGAGFTLPPEQLSGEYTISTCPAVVSCDGSLPQQEALDILTEKYLDFLTGEDTNRSFTVLEYRGVTSEILGRAMEAPAGEDGCALSPWNSLQTWEMSWESWLVDINAEFRGEGYIDDMAIGQLDPDVWYSLPGGGFPKACWLMYGDGDNWYLWSRYAYSEIPRVLK